MARPYDVAVVGAGPAGSATARLLAQQGLTVALVERSGFDVPRIGESLAPDVQCPLRALGVWDRFMALAPLPSWGTTSVWGDGEAQSHSHLLNPYGRGWHVDRRAFDRMLAESAVAAGARLTTGMTIRRCVRERGAWTLSDGPRTIRARLAIDATGRAARIGRSLGATSLRFDRLVGIATRWTGVDPAARGHLSIETAANGWWYAAPLPGDGAMIAMLMTDADMCAHRALASPDGWRAMMDAADVTRRRLSSARSVSSPRVHCAESRFLDRSGGGDEGPWLAVGDAALAVDPVSGSGVLRALEMAGAAAATALALLDTSARGDAIADYQLARTEDCGRYLAERAQYYAAERRFDTLFWRRRQLPPPVSANISWNPETSVSAAA